MLSTCFFFCSVGSLDNLATFPFANIPYPSSHKATSLFFHVEMGNTSSSQNHRITE